MKRQLVVVLMMLGAGCAARAQEAVQDSQAVDRNVAADFSAAPVTNTAVSPLAPALALSPASSFGPATSAASPFETAAPDPSPAPDPKFIYGGRDDFRWQLGIGADWLRFRNSVFNASAVGVKSSVTYFTNEWFGIEGNVSATFAPEIFDREHVKVLVYGAGPKIAWREKKWEPWAHAIIGGSHEQPQTAGNSKNAFAVQVGGGADYRFNPRFSGRLEADWVHTNYFSQSQNNFELMGGVVFHF
ncbi:MAG TPA: outer membrane beta-barrel protein [Candidatus Acidoferrum sp.]|nr:outer membrane beta-barrel protein [Candidatus Acidoferrum sp.]